MRKTLLALSCLTLAACNQAPDQASISRQLATQQVLPAYQAWLLANQQLSQSANAFCQGSTDLAQARQQLLAVQQHWAALQPLAVGPLSEGNLAWQVQFWPDKKNLVQRQVEALLTSKPQLVQADLDSASVVVQGLSAYEYVLFDLAIDLGQAEQKARYCPLLTGIATHQQQLAGRVLEQWQAKDGMLAQLSQFPNARFADGQEAVAELLRTQVNALELLKKKLGTPLGRQSKGQPQPYQAEAWRSQASLALIGASLGSAQTLWQGSEEGSLRQLLPSAQQPLAEQIDQAWLDTQAQFKALDQPLDVLLKDAAGRERLNAFYDSLSRLHQLHASQLAKALNIQLGFNAHDGD